jgi:hypothetical protein
MFKFIAALVAVVAAGLGGAILVPRADAQAVDEPVIVIQEDEAVEQVRRFAEPRQSEFLAKQFAELGNANLLHRWVQAQGQPAATYFMPTSQTGTWQIVSHDKLALLLNTASGETFVLREQEGRLSWQPIPRPKSDAPRVAVFPSPDFRAKPAQPPRAELKREADQAKRLVEATRQIDRIEAELAEIQAKLKDAGPDEKEKLREKRRALEKELDDLEASLRKHRSGR